MNWCHVWSTWWSFHNHMASYCRSTSHLVIHKFCCASTKAKQRGHLNTHKVWMRRGAPPPYPSKDPLITKPAYFVSPHPPTQFQLCTSHIPNSGAKHPSELCATIQSNTVVSVPPPFKTNFLVWMMLFFPKCALDPEIRLCWTVLTFPKNFANVLHFVIELIHSLGKGRSKSSKTKKLLEVWGHNMTDCAYICSLFVLFAAWLFSMLLFLKSKRRFYFLLWKKLKLFRFVSTRKRNAGWTAAPFFVSIGQLFKRTDVTLRWLVCAFFRTGFK